MTKSIITAKADLVPYCLVTPEHGDWAQPNYYVGNQNKAASLQAIAAQGIGVIHDILSMLDPVDQIRFQSCCKKIKALSLIDEARFSQKFMYKVDTPLASKIHSDPIVAARWVHQTLRGLAEKSLAPNQIHAFLNEVQTHQIKGEEDIAWHKGIQAYLSYPDRLPAINAIIRSTHCGARTKALILTIYLYSRETYTRAEAAIGLKILAADPDNLTWLLSTDGLVEGLEQLLISSTIQEQYRAIGVLQNLASHANNPLALPINNGLPEGLNRLLHSQDRLLKSDVIKTLLNLSCHPDIRPILMNHQPLMSTLQDLLQGSEDYSIVYIVWVFANFSHDKDCQVSMANQAYIIEAFKQFLRSLDDQVISYSLRFLANLNSYSNNQEKLRNHKDLVSELK